MVQRGQHGSPSRAEGAGAVAPQQIPLRGWLLILRRVGRRVAEDKFPLYSAGVAFFAVLSVAPVLLTALSVYGAINTPAQALDHLSGLAALMLLALPDSTAKLMSALPGVDSAGPMTRTISPFTSAGMPRASSARLPRVTSS